jgi:hypothetical protein
MLRNISDAGSARLIRDYLYDSPAVALHRHDNLPPS